MLSLRGLVRPRIDPNNRGAVDVSSQFNKSVTGYGVGATVVVNLLDGTLTASGNPDDGLGCYLDTTSNGFGAVANFGLPGIDTANATVNAVSVYGGMVCARFFLPPSLRTNLALGGARPGPPDYTTQFGGCVGSAFEVGTCSTVNASEWAGSINLVWSPFTMVDIGFECQHVERVLRQ